ncbi:MAG: sensor histidine kinase [Acidobacteriota bacterium]
MILSKEAYPVNGNLKQDSDLNCIAYLEYYYYLCQVKQGSAFLRKTKLKLFQSLAVRKKLIGIILLISFISLILTFCLIVFYKSRADRVQFIDGVKQHAKLAGDLCREALAKKDKKGMERGLSVFQSIPYVVDSVIFGPEEKALASYHSTEEKHIPANLEQTKSFEFKDGYLYVLVPVSDEEQTYGNIFLRASADALNRKLKLYIIFMGALFVLALFLVYFLARHFQSIISRPISNLVTATKKISGSGDAGIQIKKRKKNEFLILRERLKYLLELENIREMKLEEISQARQQVIELEKSRKEYRERFENCACGIFVFEADDRGEKFVIKDLNNTGEKIEQIHRADLIGKSLTDVYPEVRNSELSKALHDVWLNDTEKHIPYSKLKKEDERWREFFINQLPSREIAAVFRDVTDKKAEEETRQKEIEGQKRKLEEELKQSKEMVSAKLEEGVEVRALNNELEGLFSAAASCLEDPLEKINSFSKLFLQEYAGNVDDEGKNQLIQIRAASHRMAQMIKDLNKVAELSFAPLKLEPIDLSDMVRKRVVKLKEGNPDRKAEFSIQDGIKVRGDNRMLSIVIDNLLTNAWIYSSKKTDIKIEFGVKENKETKEYYIKDNGIGFKMKDVDEMFRPFKRLNEDEVFPGSGMGLAIVRRIIHKHGGTIRAEGSPGKGAIFYFTLGT